MVLRMPTGISGFDDMIEGGIPAGSIVLLGGNAGSGKTLFVSHMINSNAKFGKTLYYGFYGKKDNLVNHASKFGIDFKKLESEDKLAISELFPLLESGITLLVSVIERDINKFQPSLLVIDSISTLAGDLKGKQEMRILLKMIDSITKNSNITVILVTEIPLNLSGLGFGVEEFMADGIVLLRYVEMDGMIKRCLGVMKMRDTNHDMNIREYVIGPTGIEVKETMKGANGLLLAVSTTTSTTLKSREQQSDGSILGQEEMLATEKQDETAVALSKTTSAGIDPPTAAIKGTASSSTATMLFPDGTRRLGILLIPQTQDAVEFWTMYKRVEKSGLLNHVGLFSKTKDKWTEEPMF